MQAGHPHPAVLRADGRIDYIGEGGLPVGLIGEDFLVSALAKDMPSAGSITTPGPGVWIEAGAATPPTTRPRPPAPLWPSRG